MTLRRQPPPPAGLRLDRGQLVTVGECDRPPAENGWLHEIKNDGWRLALLTDGKGGIRLQTKTAADRTWDFIDPVRELAGCGHSMILDGEIAVQDERGVTRLDALHQAMRAGRVEKLVYYAFDILHLDGEDLRDRAIEYRKGRLVKALSQSRSERVIPIDGIVDYGPSIFHRVGELGCEGIVSKRLGSPYRGGLKPSSDWIKSIHPTAVREHG